MVYLIGGAPRIGKSLVAKGIAESLKGRLISTDEICEWISKSLSEEERAARFQLPPFSGDPLENTLAPEDRVKLQVVSAQSSESEIDKIISEAISNNQTLVIEGVHLLPVFVQGLIQKQGQENISSLFVGSTDVDLIVKGIMNNTNPDNWMRTSDPVVIRQVAEFAAAFSKYIQIEAVHYGLNYVERTEDFEDDLRSFSKML